MAGWLDRYPPPPERQPAPPETDPAERQRQLRRMKPQEVLDLHGLGAAEAARRVESFLAECRARGLEKVLIIHGKGNHSRGQPVLGAAIRRVLEQSPHAGAFGPADGHSGGRGALWVIVRQRSR